MFRPSLVLNAPAPAASTVRITTFARRIGLAIWNALEESGRRRAARELAGFAALHADRYPELAARYSTHRATAAATPPADHSNVQRRIA